MMRNRNGLMMRSVLAVVFVLTGVLLSSAQQTEPEFVGEAYLLKADGTSVQLDKEIGNFTSGMSWSHNSNKAFWIEVTGGHAKSRFAAGEPIQLVVRAVDSNSDPLTIVTIYKFKAKKKSRSAYLGRDNTGTFLKSKTSSEAMMRFSGKKYGTSSYLITPDGLTAGEYGMVVSNPNNRDEKKVVVSCFAID